MRKWIWKQCSIRYTSATNTLKLFLWYIQLYQVNFSLSTTNCNGCMHSVRGIYVYRWVIAHSGVGLKYECIFPESWLVIYTLNRFNFRTTDWQEKFWFLDWIWNEARCVDLAFNESIMQSEDVATGAVENRSL